MTTPLELARAFIAKLPLAVSGQRGHDATFRVACCLVHGFALPHTEALMLIREWNEQLAEKWTERELTHKIEDAGRIDHQHPRGHLLKTKVPYRGLKAPPASQVVVWPLRRRTVPEPEPVNPPNINLNPEVDELRHHLPTPGNAEVS